eukprot:1036586-Rhodomonas_salina.1
MRRVAVEVKETCPCLPAPNRHARTPLAPLRAPERRSGNSEETLLNSEETLSHSKPPRPRRSNPERSREEQRPGRR